jgi:topoisomerase-4 subunit A
MFVGVLSGEPKDFVMLASSSGYGFRAVIEDLLSRGKSGKQILNVGKAGVAISPALVQPDDKFVACATAKGFILVFDIKELSQMSKGKGVKLIKLSKGDSVVSVATGGAKASLNWGAGSSNYQMSPKQWRAHLGERATAGIKPAKGHKIKYIWFEE